MYLFSNDFDEKNTPIAERIRPQSLDEFIGQQHILGRNKPLRRMIEKKEIRSMILWGPPGTGKTTLAKIIANSIDANFLSYSAVTSGIKEIREIIKNAVYLFKAKNRRTIIFVDELHHFNKSQQDTFLPYVEDGTIIFIGATTENPSFEIISPLLSRCRIYILKPLSVEEIKLILKRALSHPKGLLPYNPKIEEELLEFIAVVCDGDARRALNYLELAVLMTDPDENGIRRIKREIVEEVVEKKVFLYDKRGEEHYNLISAFIKSMRGSDPNATIYWLARMLEAGEDPLFIARRMIIFASEDIGNADPMALVFANAAKEAVHFVGMPEAELILAQVSLYLATAPKSNASFKALKLAKEDAVKTRAEPVPMHLRNPSTALLRRLGYGKGYIYPHENNDSDQKYLPENLGHKEYYFPTEKGFEKEIKRRMKK